MGLRRLKVVAGTEFCPGGISCPTVYRRTESGSFVVQGKKLDDETRQEIAEAAGGAFPNGEDAVEIPADLIRRLARELDV